MHPPSPAILRSTTAALLAAAMCTAVATAQAKPRQPGEKFPPPGYEVERATAGPSAGPGSSPRLDRDPRGALRLRGALPSGFTEFVVTDGDGRVRARGGSTPLALKALTIGDRYTVYASAPTRKRCRILLQDFVRYPGTVVPSEQWRPHKRAQLPLRNLRQHSPATRREAATNPHRVTFTIDPAPPDGVIYVLARVEAGGQDQVAAQSLTPTLPFWFRARRGESFRIYELHPQNRTFRVSKVHTIERNAPGSRPR